MPNPASAAAVETASLQAGDGTHLQMTLQRVVVPRRHASPGDGAYELATVRIHHPAAAADAPVHLMLAGGPGASGIELVRGLARRGGAALFELLGGDLVGIDQRGTGASIPNLDDATRFTLPTEAEGDPERWAESMRTTLAAAVMDARADGVDLATFNSVESADDVEAVLQALGLRRIVLWGRSYGSHLALAVLRRHPQAVDRAVLASPEGPDHTLKRPAAVDAVLGRLDARIAEAASSTGVTVPLQETIVALLERVAGTPVVVDTRHPQTGQAIRVHIARFDLQWLLTRMLSQQRTLAMLPEALRQMAAGEYRRAGAIIALHRSQLGIGSLMKQAVDAASGASSARRRAIAEDAERALLGNAINFPAMWLEGAVEVPDLGDGYHAPFASDVPVLLLAGDLDVRTPVENAHELAAVLGHAQVVVIENGAHDFGMFDSPRLRERLRQFLRGEAVDTTPIRLPLPIAVQQ